MTNKKEFYNISKVLSYQFVNNIIVGARGVGKTFSCKVWLLKRFINHGEQFIYLRRTLTELEEIDKEKFFSEELLDHVFNFKVENYNIEVKRYETVIKFDVEKKAYVMKITSKRVILNGKIVCYMKPLNSGVKVKGSEYEDVYSILFDEFMIDRSQSQAINYLPNEINSFLNFYFSVFRLRTGVRTFLLGNATDVNNPYYNYLNFDGNQDKRFNRFKEKEFIVEFPPHNPKDLVEEDHAFFNMIKGTEVEKTITENKYQQNYNDNIHKLSGYKNRLFSINTKDIYLTLYDVEGTVYVSDSFDKNLSAYCFDMGSIKKNVIYANRSHNVSQFIRKNYFHSNIIYDTVNTRNTFNNMVGRVL